jgi:hypothetical protein
MKYERKYGKEVPISYLSFLIENPNGCYIDFRVDPEYDSETKMFSQTELTNNIEMNFIGNALQFESLKLNIKLQRDFGFADVDEPNLNEEEMKRVENGFVIGYDENFGGYVYIYLDGLENHSVWLYDTNDGRISMVANSFEGFIKNSKKIIY